MGAARRGGSLSVRLLGTYVLIVGSTLLVVGAAAVYLTRAHLSSALDRRMDAIAEEFQRGPARSVQRPEDVAPVAERWLADQAIADEYALAVRASDGRVLTAAGGVDLHRFPDVRPLLLADRPRRWQLESEDERIRGLSLPLMLGDRPVGTLVVGASERQLDRTVSALVARIGWTSAAGLILAAGLAVVSVRRTLRPLWRMTRDIEDIQATGDLSRRVDDAGAGGEVEVLTEAFNRMLSRLGQSFEAQQRFVSDASHELRTPLTVARGQLELLAEEIRSAGARHSVRLATAELDRMGRIVEDLLLLARLDEGMSLRLEPVEMDLAVGDALLRAMREGARQVHVEVPPGLSAVADPDRLLQVLTNLFTNAGHHTPPGATISVTGRRAGSEVQLDVSDDGPGIPEEELPHLFERLYRGEGATRGSPDGAGLGLAITASLTRAMGGSIHVTSVTEASATETSATEPGSKTGTTFTVLLPAADEPVVTQVPQEVP